MGRRRARGRAVDASVLLDKPSGMAVHGGSGQSLGVIEALRSMHPQSRFLELAREGFWQGQRIHEIQREGENSGLHVIVVRADGLEGGADPRREGQAVAVP